MGDPTMNKFLRQINDRTLFPKFFSLLGVLILISSISSFVPSSSILMTGLVTIMVIELTRLRYPQNTVVLTLLILSAMTLLWGWAGPLFQPISRPLAVLMILGWGTFCFSSRKIPEVKIFRSSTLIIGVLTIVIFLQSDHGLISPLLWGYDNSAHIPALSQVYRHGGFIYSGQLPQDFTFSNYVNGYPPLQQGTWSFLMSIANAQMSGGYEVLRYFSFFFFGTGILTASLVAAEWSQVNFPTKNITINKIFVLAVALLVTFSQISYVFWMGFPPFLWTCCIILAIVKVITDEKIQSRRVMIGIFGLTLVNYSYPLLSPVLIFVLVFELIKMSKNDYLFVWTHKKIMSVLVLIATVLNVAVVMKSLNVRHYVDDEGGIQPIDVKNFFLLVSVVTMLVIFSRLTLRTMPLIVFTFYASLINFGALALISKRSVGYVSYYPVKAGYLVIILGIASLGGIIRFVPKIYGRGLIHFLTILLAVGVLCFYNTNASSSKLDFTSTQSAWKHLFHNSKDQNRECFLHAMDTTSDLNLNADNRTILFQQHDLNTRWINGIRGRLIDATYSLAIPVGQAKQSLPEILEWWTVQFPNVRILILAAEPPTGLEKWSDKIEYRHFACG
jgi:hypothetical protein